MSQLIKRLKEEREKLGLTQESLSLLIGEGKYFVSSYEEGKGKPSSKISELSKQLGISYFELTDLAKQDAIVNLKG